MEDSGDLAESLKEGREEEEKECEYEENGVNKREYLNTFINR